MVGAGAGSCVISSGWNRAVHSGRCAVLSGGARTVVVAMGGVGVVGASAGADPVHERDLHGSQQSGSGAWKACQRCGWTRGRAWRGVSRGPVRAQRGAVADAAVSGSARGTDRKGQHTGGEERAVQRLREIQQNKGGAANGGATQTHQRPGGIQMRDLGQKETD